MDVRAQVAGVIQKYLDQAVDEGAIAPIDTRVTAFAWLGAINEIVIRWVVTGDPERLEDVIPSLRALLLRSIGIRI